MHRMGALLYHYVSPLLLTNYAIQREETESDKKMICEIGEGERDAGAGGGSAVGSVLLLQAEE